MSELVERMDCRKCVIDSASQPTKYNGFEVDVRPVEVFRFRHRPCPDYLLLLSREVGHCFRKVRAVLVVLLDDFYSTGRVVMANFGPDAIKIANDSIRYTFALLKTEVSEPVGSSICCNYEASY